MEKEYARIKYVEATGTVGVLDVDITGPTTEAVRILDWTSQVISRDGGKVLAVQFGTKQNGTFKERIARPTPHIAFDGFRRMSAHLRA